MRLSRYALATMSLALLPVALPVAHDADAATSVLLRYRFTPGEVLTYQLSATDTLRMVVSGRTVDRGTATMEYRAHVIVRSVDSAGNALLSIINDRGRIVTNHNGVVTHRTAAGDTLTSPVNACYQEVSGTQYCSYRGAFGLNDVGQASDAPVARGATWTSRIDNTWAVAQRTPVYLRNALQGLSTGPSGRAATVITTGQVKGATGFSQGDTITGTLAGRIDGTWRLMVETGLFTDESLRQSYDITGLTRVGHQIKPAAVHAVSIMTMHLLSVTSGQPTPFRAPGPLTTHTDALLGFRITYPAAWMKRTSSNGSFEAASKDGNAAIVVARSSQANPALATNAAYLQALASQFGTPADPVRVGTAVVRGHAVGVADTVVASVDTTEFQCEVEAIATRHGLYYLASMVTLGRPQWALRLPHAAWRIEAVRRALDSMTVSS